MELINIIISEEFSGLRLDILINKIIEEVPSRSFAAKLIDKEYIKINSKTAKPAYKTKFQDILSIDLSFLTSLNPEPQPEAIQLNILYEDEHILVINKPAGLVVHPGAGVSSGTLVNAVLAHCGCTLPTLGEKTRAGIVHRLDKDTTGVMVVAKTQLALTKLSMQFAEHKQTRIYTALIYGKPVLNKGVIETHHGRDPRNRIKYAVVAPELGKFAKLEYELQTTFQQGLISQVKCKLFTGKTHQIRVQMTHLGHPLLGDSLYGTVPAAILKQTQLWAKLKPLLKRQMLHANVLEFCHPQTLELMCFKADIPEDFSEVLNLIK